MNKTLSFITLALIGAAASEISYAKDRSNRLGLGVDVGAAIPIAPTFLTDNVDTGYTGGAHVRYHFNSYLGADFSYNRLEFSDSPMGIDAVDAGLFARVFGSSDLTPWVSAGIGPHHISAYGLTDNYWRFGVKGELGLEYDIAEAVSLGAKLGYFFTTENDHSVHALTPGLAATWYFGGKDKADSKKSGPAAPAAAAAGAGAAGVVAADGAKPGAVPDEAAALSSVNIEFDSGKAAVKQTEEDEIAQIADILQQQPQAKAVIEGHTDSVGDANKNMELSKERAENVREILVDEYGIDASRLDAVGYGYSQPIAPNDTANGRALNRRVMIVTSMD